MVEALITRLETIEGRMASIDTERLFVSDGVTSDGLVTCTELDEREGLEAMDMSGMEMCVVGWNS